MSKPVIHLKTPEKKIFFFFRFPALSAISLAYCVIHKKNTIFFFVFLNGRIQARKSNCFLSFSVSWEMFKFQTLTQFPEK